MDSNPALGVAPNATSAAPKLPLRTFLRRVYADIPSEVPGSESAVRNGAVEAAAPVAGQEPAHVLLLDVRSPAEYARGHVPGANSLPLFNDSERAQVGLSYKHSGRFAAIQLGLSLVGPKLASMVQRVQDLGAQPGSVVLVYCWRGGMRSSSVCWLLNLCGYDASALDGGYRAFRSWVQNLMHSQSLAAAVEPEDIAERKRTLAVRVAASLAGGAPGMDALVVDAAAAATAPSTEDTKASATASLLPALTVFGTALGSSECGGGSATITYGEYFTRAKAAKDAGDWEAAAHAYACALVGGHPRRSHCLWMVGVCLARQRDFGGALRCYDEALQAVQVLAGHAAGEARTVLQLHELRAEALEALGRPSEAAAALELASCIEPSTKRSKEAQRLTELADRLARAPGSQADAGGDAGLGEDDSEGNRKGGDGTPAHHNLPCPTPSLSESLPHERPLAPLCVLGGRTGSGKTALLHALKDMGEQVLDLEGLAEHMGSAFGRVGQVRPQPSNEMFENLVALAWRRADASRALWVEHEGRHVGSCLVPARLFSCLRAPELLVLLNVPRAARVRHLVAMYATQGAAPAAFTEALGGSEAVSAAVSAIEAPGGKASVGASTVAELASAIESLCKRRGGAATAAALEQLARGDYAAVADSALEYYDALYDEYARSSRRHHVLEVSCDEAGRAADATRVLAAVREWRVVPRARSDDLESNVKSVPESFN